MSRVKVGSLVPPKFPEISVLEGVFLIAVFLFYEGFGCRVLARVRISLRAHSELSGISVLKRLLSF